VTGFTSDLFHMDFKAVSATPFCAEAEVFAAADAVVTHISSRSFFIAQFALALLTARPTLRILSNIIFYQIVSPSICIM
jgi:hypothetical protein